MKEDGRGEERRRQESYWNKCEGGRCLGGRWERCRAAWYEENEKKAKGRRERKGTEEWGGSRVGVEGCRGKRRGHKIRGGHEEVAACGKGSK